MPPLAVFVLGGVVGASLSDLAGEDPDAGAIVSALLPLLHTPSLPSTIGPPTLVNPVDRSPGADPEEESPPVPAALEAADLEPPEPEPQPPRRPTRRAKRRTKREAKRED